MDGERVMVCENCGREHGPCPECEQEMANDYVMPIAWHTCDRERAVKIGERAVRRERAV